MSAEQTSSCAKCKGTGFRYAGPQAVVRCECKTENRSERLIRAAEIPSKYADCRLDNYITSDKNNVLQMAHVKATGYVDQYFTQATPRGLLFQGMPGLGKTHLAVGIIRKLMEQKPIPCFFCNFSAELQKIRDSMNTSATKTLILPRLVYEAEVLVLDDFGTQKWSSWVQEQMSNVISNRYDNGRATILTTNLTDSPGSEERNAGRAAAMKRLGVMDTHGEIDNFALRRFNDLGIYFNSPGDEPENLEEQIGDRLRSRLYEMCDVVPMFGDDFRRVKARQRSRDILKRK